MLSPDILTLLQEIASDGDLATIRPSLRQAALELLAKDMQERERRENYFLYIAKVGGQA